MKTNRIVALALIAMGAFGATASLQSSSYKKVRQELVYSPDRMDQALEVIYARDPLELDRLYDASIFSGHLTQFPLDFRSILTKFKMKMPKEKWKKMTLNQLKELSLKFYANRLKSLLEDTELGTSRETLKQALLFLSDDFFNKNGFRYDPVTYRGVKIASAKAFEDSRYFTLEEYRKLINNLMKEYGSDTSEIVTVEEEGAPTNFAPDAA